MSNYIIYLIQAPLVAFEVTLLTAGIVGATVISVFSSDLPGTFIVARTGGTSATAAIFSEPDDVIPRTSISRQTSYGNSHHNEACPRPKLRLGAKFNQLKEKSLFQKIMKRISNVQQKVSPLKMRLVNKLGIGCLVPKIIRPFEPTFRYLRCKLGLEEDDFMEAMECSVMNCDDPLEDKVITNDLNAPIEMMDLDVQTMSDCFGDMREVNYGVRAFVKIIQDESCDEPKNQDICQEVLNDPENRVIEEETCQTRK